MITSRQRSGGELVFGLVADVPGGGSCPLMGPTGYVTGSLMGPAAVISAVASSFLTGRMGVGQGD